jgi:hypothetical protein
MSDVPFTPEPPSLTPPPPPPPPPPVTPAKTEFDFVKPFAYVFEDPRWLTKILIGGLFYLAGFMLIGWFFILGYVAQTMRNVILGQPRPLPEWDNLGDYFGEGAMLFAVGFVWMLPIFALVGMIIVPAIASGALQNHGSAGAEALSAMTAGITGVLSCLMVPVGLAITVFLPASFLFVVVERRFGAAFELGRIWTFIRNNLANYLLAVVVYLVARFLGGFGVALCCIGVVFTGFWSFLITGYAFAQTYRLATTAR